MNEEIEGIVFTECEPYELTTSKELFDGAAGDLAFEGGGLL
jgi:hypothetical protein